MHSTSRLHGVPFAPGDAQRSRRRLQRFVDGHSESRLHGSPSGGGSGGGSEEGDGSAGGDAVGRSVGGSVGDLFSEDGPRMPPESRLPLQAPAKRKKRRKKARMAREWDRRDGFMKPLIRCPASEMASNESGVVARLDETVSAVRAKMGKKSDPRVGVVLGSGLGAFADSLTDLVKVPYSEIPNLPASKVVGHAGNLCFGNVDDVPVVCMQGRIHLYEGHPIWQVVHGVRTMARLGVKCVLLTNAAGGLADGWAAGDLMIVTDHLNLMYQHPLLGPNEEALGTRFPDMTNAYDAELRAQLEAVSRKEKIELRQGVYAGLPGPSYETPAEIRML